AIQTTPPMEIARAPKAGAVQPRMRKTAQVAINVAIAIPEIGFDDVPISPVMRDDTVTNKNPKMMTKMAAATFAPADVYAPGTGLKQSIDHLISITSSAPPRAIFALMSLSVRKIPAASFAPLPRSFAPARSAAMIVGVVLSKVISPAAA